MIRWVSIVLGAPAVVLLAFIGAYELHANSIIDCSDDIDDWSKVEDIKKKVLAIPFVEVSMGEPGYLEYEGIWFDGYVKVSSSIFGNSIFTRLYISNGVYANCRRSYSQWWYVALEESLFITSGCSKAAQGAAERLTLRSSRH
ncbi:hypothetical protein QP938_02280 [Porticoccaceae bacterium LTM1]|nr:hypothetical protein QP938_02280 [Porticoccaceae bacterium LTM1]